MDCRYIPSEGDVVIGEVTRVSYSRWNVDLDSPYEGTLNIIIIPQEPDKEFIKRAIEKIPVIESSQRKPLKSKMGKA